MNEMMDRVYDRTRRRLDLLLSLDAASRGPMTAGLVATIQDEIQRLKDETAADAREVAQWRTEIGHPVESGNP